MYISKVLIEGFRNFQLNEIIFNDGINVIIGHNNAGKTNLLKALALVLDTSGVSKRLDIDDFNKSVGVHVAKSTPPTVKVSLFFDESNGEPDSSDDLATVSNWIVKLDKPYQARLTYEFYLPEKEKGDYIKLMTDVATVEDAWAIINRDFIRKYVYKVFGGDPGLQYQAEGENLQKFDFQFLTAIRDVERDMFTGKNTLLKEVLQFFIDYEIKKDSGKSLEERKEELRKRQITFQETIRPALQNILSRIDAGQKEILDYATQTGASFNNAKPGFEGNITEIEFLSALKLVIEQSGIKVPATHNGLGYNNLIYMSLLLAKMQANTDGSYYGSNAKVFPVLVIEEPEAHLHPSMQYKFLKFLKENKKNKVRQVFVTTHSTHITSAVTLDEIICLSVTDGNLHIGYPGMVFDDNEAGIASKKYVERFLDATKSNMLFAQKVILVEGITEQILMPVIAKRVNPAKQLEDHQVEVINIGGRYFDHFLKLFDITHANTIKKKIACVTDRDPERKSKGENVYRKCYPFESNLDLENFDYKESAKNYLQAYDGHPTIRFFSQDEVKGKTFEYDLVLNNPGLELLLTDSTSNRDELVELFKAYNENKTLEEFVLRESEENRRIMDCLKSDSCMWDAKDKKIAVLASRYLNSTSKGVNALELAVKLSKDIDSGSSEFNPPEYLKRCVEWLI